MTTRPAPREASTEVTGAQRRRLAVAVLGEQLPLAVEGDRYTEDLDTLEAQCTALLVGSWRTCPTR